MKKSRLYIHVVAAVLLMLPMLTGCRSELCYNHYPSIDVAMDWEYEWERDYGMAHSSNWNEAAYGHGYDDLRPSTPEWVTLLRYSDAEEPIEKHLSPDGGEFVVDRKEGTSMLFYNSDTEYLVFADLATLSEARATATPRSRATLAYITEKYPNARSMNPPDVLYSAYIENVPAAQVHEVMPMPVKMQPLVFTYLIRYEIEEGLDDVYLARGALGGMAESVYLRDGRTSDNAAIMIYDCTLTSYGCEAKVKSFGVPGFPDKYYGRQAQAQESEKAPFVANLELLLDNGKTYSFDTDISDQLLKQPKGGVITIKGLKIPQEAREPDPMNSGFDVDVTDWGNNVNIDLPVGSE